MLRSFQTKIFFIGLASFFLVVLNAKDTSDTNTASRHATIDSLYRKGTYIIDSSPFIITHDKLFWKGHFYSPKPPLLSTVATLPYWAYVKLTGNTFQKNFRKAVRFLSIAIGATSHLFFLYFFYHLLLLFDLSPKTILISFISVSFGYLGMGFATTLNNHTPTATALLMSIFFVLSIQKSDPNNNWRWIFSGFFAALASTFDHPSLFFSLGIFLFVFQLNKKKALTLFSLGAGVPLITHFAITYASTGIFMPLQWNTSLFFYPGSYWHNPRQYDAIWEPKYKYLFHMLLGHHGFISMTPVIGLGLFRAIKSVVERDKYKHSALLVLLSTLAMIIFYTKKTHSYGGCSVGFRWLIPAMPPFFLFAAFWLEEHQKRVAFLFFLLLISVGVFNTFDALGLPWKCYSRWNELFIWMGLGSKY